MMSCPYPRSPAATGLIVAVGLLAACIPAAGPARAQHTHGASEPRSLETRPDVIAFVEQARAATERFKDRTQAIAAGYRLVGPDMPNMGEHWVHVSRALQRTFNPARPSVLTYVQVAGRPVLTGVAYTMPITAGEEPPDFPFFGAWHYHTGSLVDEAFGLTMHRSSAPVPQEGPRLAMVHAWIYTPNPDGLFAPDNWALSFVRLGIRPPKVPSSEAARALFLAAGGDAYYLQAIHHVGDLTPVEYAAVQAILARHRAGVEPVAEAMQGRGEEATSDEDLQLASIWKALWDDLRAALPSVDEEQLTLLMK